MKTTLPLIGLHCASCAAACEKSVQKLDGVNDVYVNLAVGTLTIDYDPQKLQLETVAEAIKKAGFTLLLTPPETGREEREARAGFRGMAAAVALSLVLSYTAMHAMFGLPFPAWNIHVQTGIQAALLAAIIFFGRDFYLRGIPALLRGRPDMNTLIAVGTGAATLYSLALWIGGDISHVYFDAAGMIVALVMLGKYLELRSRQRASSAVRELLGIAPVNATLVLDDGREQTVPIAELRVGDTVLVRPGEKFPVDGEVIEGSGAVDESMLTGEPVPAEKLPGSQVSAGSISRDGAFRVKAHKVGQQTLLSGIVKRVEEAQSGRAPISRLADRVSGWFVWAVLLAAAATLTLWLLAGSPFDEALSFTLAVLVIACPCALGLATPVAVIAGISRAAREGILIKDGEALENSGKISLVVFDKTGTLTQGKMSLRSCSTLPDCGFSPDEMLAVAAAAENNSEHPLARAVAAAASERALELPPISDFAALPGYGVKCVCRGRQWFFGNAKLLAEQEIDQSYFAENPPDGPCILAGCDGMAVGMLVFFDALRPTSVEAVARLKKLHLHVAMFTGDHEIPSAKVAKVLQLDEFHAGLLPGDKADMIQRLRRHQPGLTAMVGDGINDAPALSTADVGMALSGGTDVAVESAGVVLMRDDPNLAADTVELSRFAVQIIHQNLFWAFFYNAIGIPLAAGLFFAFGGPKLSPVFAAAAMAFSSISVVLNALRLRRWQSSKKSNKL